MTSIDAIARFDLPSRRDGAFVVSLHDVAPATWHQSRRWLDEVEEFGLRATLLVVPGPWRGEELSSAPAFVAWLHDAAAAGHELALHGWEHRAVADPDGSSRYAPRRYGAIGDVLARGCQEFWQLGRVEAVRRVMAGLEVLRDHDIDPLGFTPPGWLASPETIEVLQALGFAYTTTHLSVLDLRDGGTRSIPALSQRPGSSVTGIAASGNEWLARRRLRRAAPVRLALHPDDLADPRLLRVTRSILSEAVTVGARNQTYLDLVLERPIVQRPIDERATIDGSSAEQPAIEAR